MPVKGVVGVNQILARGGIYFAARLIEGGYSVARQLLALQKQYPDARSNALIALREKAVAGRRVAAGYNRGTGDYVPREERIPSNPNLIQRYRYNVSITYKPGLRDEMRTEYHVFDSDTLLAHADLCDAIIEQSRTYHEANPLTGPGASPDLPLSPYAISCQVHMVQARRR